MKTVTISQFKARCLRLLADVNESGEPLLVTRHGKALATILPAGRRSGTWLGSLKGTARIVGDLIEPAAALEEWDAHRE